MIVEELTESTLESILEEVLDVSTPEFHATKSQVKCQLTSSALPQPFKPLMMTPTERLQACPLTVQWDRIAMAKENYSLTKT